MLSAEPVGHRSMASLALVISAHTAPVTTPSRAGAKGSALLIGFALCAVELEPESGHRSAQIAGGIPELDDRGYN
ncbi:MAG: hypothetical protein ACREU7_07800, partial [Burkholderiales bacterium]